MFLCFEHTLQFHYLFIQRNIQVIKILFKTLRAITSFGVTGILWRLSEKFSALTGNHVTVINLVTLVLVVAHSRR